MIAAVELRVLRAAFVLLALSAACSANRASDPPTSPTLRSDQTLSASPSHTRTQSPAPSPPGLTPLKGVALSLERSYYEVRGATAGELRESMDRHGLRDDGERVDALTEWYVRWRYRYAHQDGTCGIGAARVTLRIMLTLPRWNTTSTASPTLENEWDEYTKALERHEAGHVDIAVSAGNDIWRMLRSLPRYQSCSALETRADTEGTGVLRAHRSEERDYDAITNHGATQGAVFP